MNGYLVRSAAFLGLLALLIGGVVLLLKSRDEEAAPPAVAGPEDTARYEPDPALEAWGDAGGGAVPGASPREASEPEERTREFVRLEGTLLQVMPDGSEVPVTKGSVDVGLGNPEDIGRERTAPVRGGRFA